MLRFFLVFFFPFLSLFFLRICLYEKSLDTCLGIFFSFFFFFFLFILSLLSWKGFAPVGWLGHLGFHPFTLSLTLVLTLGRLFFFFPENFFVSLLFFNDSYDCPSFTSASSSAAIVYVCSFCLLVSVLSKYILNTS